MVAKEVKILYHYMANETIKLKNSKVLCQVECWGKS